MPGCRSPGIRSPSPLRATYARLLRAWGRNRDRRRSQKSRTSRDRRSGAVPGVASRPPTRGGPMSIVIVGAGLAGGTAATELREQGYDRAGRARRGRGAPALRAAAAVEGLPARQRPDRRRLRAPASTGTPSTTSTCGSGSRPRRSTPTPTWCTPAAATSPTSGCCWPPGPSRGGCARRRGQRGAHGVPAHHRGQRPAQGGLREGRPDRGRRGGLDRARGRRGGSRGRVRGHRLRDGRPAAAAGARADRRAGLRRPAPRATASTCAWAPR